MMLLTNHGSRIDVQNRIWLFPEQANDKLKSRNAVRKVPKTSRCCNVCQTPRKYTLNYIYDTTSRIICVFANLFTFRMLFCDCKYVPVIVLYIYIHIYIISYCIESHLLIVLDSNIRFQRLKAQPKPCTHRIPSRPV